MYAGRKSHIGRLAEKLTRERAREILLSILPGRTAKVAAMVENPAQINRSAALEDLLKEMLQLLQINATVEILASARKHLEQICSTAESEKKTFEASLANLRERATAKVNVKTLGASVLEEDYFVLARVHKVASEGGEFKRLTREAIALHSFLVTGTVKERIQHSEIGRLSEEGIRELGTSILNGRVRISKELKRPTIPIGNSKVVRNLRRDVLRHQIIAKFKVPQARDEQIEMLSQLFDDSSIESVRFLIEIVLDASRPLEVREVACCAVEHAAHKVSMYDANEIGRNLLARLTRFCVLFAFEPIEVVLLLRMFSGLGNIDGAAVLTQLIEEDAIRRVYKGSPHELAIFLLVLSLLERGGTATRCLEKLVLGIGIEHVSPEASFCIRERAAAALLSQDGGVKTLLQLLEFYHDRDATSVVPKAIALALAKDDSSSKVSAVVEMLHETLTARGGVHEPHLQRLIWSLDGSTHPDAAHALQNILFNLEIPDGVRREVAFAMRSVRGSVLLRVVDEILRATTKERAILLDAVSGHPEETRLGTVAQLFSREFEVLEGAAAISEQERLLKIASSWGIL